ncbi:MAG: hypothetical protein EXR45_09545 [Chloroflexi bacterium]|nr:hypothetical protein [Chloroflexota bacterium]
MRRLSDAELVAIASSAMATAFDQAAASPSPPGEVSPCMLGCSSCCYLPVNVTVPEVVQALGAARTVIDPAQLGKRVETASANTRGLDISDRLRARVACPLLDGLGSCMIYTSRPAYCRAYNARSSRDACDRLIGSAAGLADPNAVVVADPAPFDAALDAQARIDQDLERAGARSPHLDLTHALALIIGDPATVDDWLRGDVAEWARPQ